MYMYEIAYSLSYLITEPPLLTAGVEATVCPKEHRRTPAGGRDVISGELARSSIATVT